MPPQITRPGQANRPAVPTPTATRPERTHARGLPDPRAWLSSQFTDMKEEMDHKFSLQMAENKRLQSNVRGPFGARPFRTDSP